MNPALLALLLAVTPMADSVAVGDSVARALGADPATRVDYLWVTRSTLQSRESIDRMVERAALMHVRGMLVQVVGRGDAWYRSERLPRAEGLAGTPADFDPLARVVEAAHPRGLEVHAWINCALVWSGDHPPRDPRHVARSHPEWFGWTSDGQAVLHMGPRRWKRLGIEGAYLSPAHPGVRAWVAGTAAEIARRYAVDGIHLDYIRTSGADLGFDNATRAAFALESGIDRSRLPRLTAVERTRLDTAFAAFQGRQVTAIVRAVRDSLEALRPGLVLSAAVRPDPREASRYFGQPWEGWLSERLLDRVFPMCYSPSTQVVLDQLQRIATPALKGRVIPGIAVYNAGPTRAASNLQGARALGFAQLALYSYDSLFASQRYWERLNELLQSATATQP
ncbi:MAG: family 10 glycosylhydrolase [Candidatus Eisenbacteria bacterium]|uniref:Family 10 glycosylhydrolase n=1 Tax=Eiseniibacteriota bacterium TaxID=2212470 RepID=A0A849SXJ1_UNCEI|nr:family 10 glycosylhydrolase [Candidatus Eisenbacteria bacterium]